MMTDYHVHIGQWNDVCFKAEDIFYALKKMALANAGFLLQPVACIQKQLSQEKVMPNP